MSPVRLCLAITLVLIAAAAACGAPPPLIEVQAGGEAVQGKVAAQNEQVFWLVGQDGRMRAMRSDTVKKFRQVAPQFSSWSASVLRDQLRREFGKSFEVVGTRHYAVCARGDQQARAYAETFEDLFRSFQMYFSVRGFKISEPEFPLIAVVFPDYDAFSRYARAENVPVSKTLRGYYLSTSNRIALYDDGNAAATLRPAALVDAAEFARNRGDWESPLAVHDGPFPNSYEFNYRGAFPNCYGFGYADEGAWSAIEASLKDTMIHEATHQAAFNTGLHSRIGETPKWVV